MRPEKSERPSREGRNIVSYIEANSEDEDDNEGTDCNVDSTVRRKRK